MRMLLTNVAEFTACSNVNNKHAGANHTWATFMAKSSFFALFGASATLVSGVHSVDMSATTPAQHDHNKLKQKRMSKPANHHVRVLHQKTQQMQHDSGCNRRNSTALMLFA